MHASRAWQRAVTLLDLGQRTRGRGGGRLRRRAEGQERGSLPPVTENLMTKIVLSASRDIPLNKLVLSQANVRRIKAGVSVEELAEDIARRGLLQSLSVRPGIPLSFPGWRQRPHAPDRSRAAGRVAVLFACPSADAARRSRPRAPLDRAGTIGSSLIQAFPDELSAQAALDTLARAEASGAGTSHPPHPPQVCAAQPSAHVPHLNQPPLS